MVWAQNLYEKNNIKKTTKNKKIGLFEFFWFKKQNKKQKTNNIDFMHSGIAK